MHSLCFAFARTVRWMKSWQFLDAAEKGRADDMLELLQEGANVEFKDWVHFVF
jgi:hypothetical protein